MAKQPKYRQCTATSRTTGERCRQRAMNDMKVCRYHGGKSPQAQAAAKKRRAERQILAELERAQLTGKALKGETDPLGALQKLTAELSHMKDQLTIRVNELGEQIKTQGEAGAEAAAVEVELYLKVIDRLTKTLDIALKHDIEGKKLSLETAKAELVAAALYRVLSAIGASKTQQEQAKTLLHQELTVLAGSADTS